MKASPVRPQITDHLRPAEWVGEDRCHEERVLLYTIHDGDQVPRYLFGERSEEILDRPEVAATYVAERDWGADRMARNLAAELGLSGYFKVHLARLVMDYGRFPGSSGTGAAYLQRSAIFPPFADLLSEEQKHDLLRTAYDTMSADMVDRMQGKKVAIGIHTYDPHNASGTERPQVSLVTRLLEYQIHSTVPPEVFDPIFPPILCEATCHRALSYQMLLNLERGGYHTAHNYPYVMPVGSLEIRAQVWFFFRHLRERFCELHPETRDSPAFQRVWQMLLDVNRRSADAQWLRSYLHRYREPLPGQEKVFAAARRAYARIREVLAEHHEAWVDAYRYAPERPDHLGIEVRKDLLADIDLVGCRVSPRPDAEERSRDIARHMARAIRTYLESRDGQAEEPAFSPPPPVFGDPMQIS